MVGADHHFCSFCFFYERAADFPLSHLEVASRKIALTTRDMFICSLVGYPPRRHGFYEAERNGCANLRVGGRLGNVKARKRRGGVGGHRLGFLVRSPRMDHVP